METLPWDTAPHLPWQMFMNPAEQWANLPTFLFGEYVVILCALIALVHAKRAGRANLLIWLAALIAGTCNDLIFMALPLVDNFWQGQASIMLTPRLPLYIPCMYVVFMYYPTVAVRRLGLPRWSTAALTGLVACMFYAPYDIVGAKFLWWTWHDTDAPIAARILGAPVSSSLWVLTFVGAFALLLDLVLRSEEVTSKSFAKGFALVAGLTTAMMMVQMTVLQILNGGTPGYLAFAIGLVVYAGVAFRGRGAASREQLEVDWLGRGAAIAFLTMLAFNMAVGSPEKHVSAGLHQVPGPCDVEATDITGMTRKKFLCVDNYAEDFSFACADKPAHGTQWFTVCGKAHSNYPAHLGGVAGLSATGIVVFSLLFGSMARAREDEDLPVGAASAAAS